MKPPSLGQLALELVAPVARTFEERRVEAEDATERAIERASAHAEDASPGWNERALRFLERFVRENGEAEFIAPEVRHWAHDAGLEAPPSALAWGGVFVRACRAGLIRKAGTELYGDETMHRQNVTKWRPA